MHDTSVRFVEQSGVLSVVELRTKDQPQLLAALSEILFRERVQVVRFESRVRGRRMLGRLTIVEHDGAPIDSKRRLQVQAAIFGVLDGLARRRPAAN